MANTAANVLVGKPLATGGILSAPTGTPLPPDATTAPNAAFVGVGYVSSDGVVQTLNTDTTDIKAWGGDVVRRIQTSHDLTYKFTLIETNVNSLAAYYGDANVDPGEVRIVAGDLERKEWVIEVADGTARVRIVIPDGEVTDRGDVSFTDEDAVGYELTLTCYPDGSGVKAYLYSDGVSDGVAAPIVASSSPATTPAAGGALIIITGLNFTGTTGAAGVKFGATNASSYSVVSDSKIAAIAPAHAAGAAAITVTTPAGTSNASTFSYT